MKTSPRWPLAAFCRRPRGRAPPETAAAARGLAGRVLGRGEGHHPFPRDWTVASPDLMLGVNVTTRPSKPAEFEYLRIESRAGTPPSWPSPEARRPRASS